MINTNEPYIDVHFVVQNMRHGTEPFFDSLLDIVIYEVHAGSGAIDLYNKPVVGKRGRKRTLPLSSLFSEFL